MEIPLPGHVLRPGVPAPANARLSLGLGLGIPSTPTRKNQPTTTIRLISNPFSNADVSNTAGKNGTPQLQPFKTTFDLILDSPTPTGAFGSMSTWPPRDPEDNFPMYPTLTVNDLPPSLVSAESPQVKADRQEKDEDVDMPGSLTSVRARTPFIKSPEPFIFGSPLPQHNVSNAQFRAAAASVLEEMNKRLREEGVDEIQSNIIAELHPHANILPNIADCREIKPMPGVRRGEIKEKFQKLHESEFEKMEGIDSLVKRRTERSPQKRTGEAEGEAKVIIGKKRKSGAIAKESVDVNGLGPHRPSTFASRASSTRVISNGRRSKVVIPGAFGSEEEEEDDNVRIGKRARMDSEVQLSVLEEQKKSEQEIRLEREREAIRKKLEANRARRRSSAAHGGRKSGRISAGRPSLLGETFFLLLFEFLCLQCCLSLSGKPKPKPSRFGFLSSAKSLVQSVWYRGKIPAPAIASNIAKPTLVNVNASTKPAASKVKMGPPPLGPKQKSSIAPAHPTTAVASGSRIPSVRNANNKTDAKVEEESKLTVTSSDAICKGTSTSTSSSGSRSRSPLPSFGSTSTSRNSLQSNVGTRTSRTSSIISGPNSTHNASLTRTGISRNSGHTAGVSSIGTRASSTRTSSTGAVSSMGSKKTFGGASVTSRTSSMGSSSRLSSITSRLFAPTASSLAKANGRPSSGAGGLKAVSEDQQHPPLGTITNSSTLHSANITSPNSGKIFSKPLLLPQRSGIPAPVKNQKIASSSDSTTLTRANSTQRSLTGRKPRISRSKVIARLASQRAANGNGNELNVTGGNSGAKLASRASNDDTSGRARSSLGVKVSRASYGGGTRSRASGGGRVLLSAKKRARQSEYARRKSKVVIAPLVLEGRSSGSVPSGMDVDR